MHVYVYVHVNEAGGLSAVYCALIDEQTISIIDLLLFKPHDSIFNS